MQIESCSCQYDMQPYTKVSYNVNYDTIIIKLTFVFAAHDVVFAHADPKLKFQLL